MVTCSLNKLVRLLAGKLKLDSRISVLEHLDECPNCRDAYYRMSRDRDENLFVHRRYNIEKVAAGRL
jgi:predicted anti-sigma-YlaC factor YlaD